MESRKQEFARVYAQAFRDSYPQLDTAQTQFLIEKATAKACENIRNVIIDGGAFKLTAKRLNIKHTYKAFDAFLSGKMDGWQDKLL